MGFHCVKHEHTEVGDMVHDSFTRRISPSLHTSRVQEPSLNTDFATPEPSLLTNPAT